MRGFANDVGIPWAAIEAACPEVVVLEVSGPQAIRVAACAMAAGARVERVVTRLGRCTSARRVAISTNSRAALMWLVSMRSSGCVVSSGEPA